MTIHDIISKWKLNHKLLSKKIHMPAGTFNNKNNPSHKSSFDKKELTRLKKVIEEMNKDFDDFLKS